jgi:hypothetical protein
LATQKLLSSRLLWYPPPRRLDPSIPRKNAWPVDGDPYEKIILIPDVVFVLAQALIVRGEEPAGNTAGFPKSTYCEEPFRTMACDPSLLDVDQVGDPTAVPINPFMSSIVVLFNFQRPTCAHPQFAAIRKNITRLNLRIIKILTFIATTRSVT